MDNQLQTARAPPAAADELIHLMPTQQRRFRHEGARQFGTYVALIYARFTTLASGELNKHLKSLLEAIESDRRCVRPPPSRLTGTSRWHSR